MSNHSNPANNSCSCGRLIRLCALVVGVVLVIAVPPLLVATRWLPKAWNPRQAGPIGGAKVLDNEHRGAIGVWFVPPEGRFGYFWPFRYDGEAVHLHMVRMHGWQEGTDDDIYRLPAQWEGNTLYHRHSGGVGWSKMADFVDGHFVITQDGTACVLQKAQVVQPGSLEEALARDRPMWEPAEVRERGRALGFLLERPGQLRSGPAAPPEKVEPVSTLTEPPDGPFRLRGYPYFISRLAFSPDGRRLVSVGSSWDPDRDWDSGSVSSWDLNTGRREGLFEGGTGGVSQVAFNPDGRHLAACVAPAALIWRTADRRETLRLTDLPSAPHDLSYSPDGRRLATAGDGPEVILWDSASGERLRTLATNAKKVDHVAFLPDGQQLVSVSDETKVDVWDLAAGKATHSFEAADPRRAERVLEVALHPGGKRMAFGGWSQVSVFDLTTGKPVEGFSQLEGHHGPVRSLAFSPDGRLLVSSEDDRLIKLLKFWDADTGEELFTIRGYRKDVFGLAFSPDGKRLATAGRAESIELWDVEALRAKIRR
jgi:hypothetical protein